MGNRVIGLYEINVPNAASIMQANNIYLYCRNNSIIRIDITGCYDREKAIDYAKEWYDGANTAKYERFDTIISFILSFGRNRGDCANFVSQCLVAGGLQMNSSWQYRKTKVEEWHGNNSVKRTVSIMTPSWSSAKSQFEYFSDDSNGYINGEVIKIHTKQDIQYHLENSSIQKGDLMFFVKADTDRVYHSTIISSVSDDEIKYAAHTSDRFDENLSDKLGDQYVLIVRIRDEAT